MILGTLTRRGAARVRRGRMAAFAALWLGGATAAHGQSAPARLGAELPAGGETEEYLRYLQTTGEVPAYPWSLRAFGPLEGDSLLPAAAGHPWAGHPRLRRDTTGARLRLLPVRARGWYNSAFPFATNDGPVWAGRGATVAVDAGVSYRRGVLSAALNPMVFTAQNRDFALMPNGGTGDLAFASGRFRESIDAPQRFGDGAYTRVEPGNSYIRVDTRGVAVGVTTANETWGPAGQYPLIVGSAGPGVPHLFLGTSRPVNVWIGRVHGRVEYGVAGQSQYSPVRTGSGRNRFITGLTGVFQPRGLPGLELGAGRFFHVAWPEGGLALGDFFKPFEGIVKESVRGDGTATDGSDAANQLASVFFRWAAAPAGVEVYGEYAREDHSYNFRDLVLEPEHISAFTLGVRRVWRTSPGRMTGLRAELMDARLTPLGRLRDQSPMYIHSRARQGHTIEGQFIGSPAAGFGGAGGIVAVDVYRPRGRTTGFWMREQRGASGNVIESGAIDRNARVWVAHTLGAEAVRAAGPVDLRMRLAGTLELNRYLEDRDAFNLNAELGFEWRP